MEDKKAGEDTTPKDAPPVEDLKQDRATIKSPKIKSMVKVKLVRSIDQDVALVEVVDSPGDFYLVSPDVFEPGLRHAEIATDERKPQDWSGMLNEVLPDRYKMIEDACTHLIKNGMVDIADLNNNALRTKAFKQMLNYTIPKPESKE